MLLPKRTKYRKTQRGRNRGQALRGNMLHFGDFGIKSLVGCHLTSRQLEAARKAVTGTTKRTGRLWIMVFPHTPITKKPLEVRMGSGKGSVDHYVAVVKPGKVLFELAGVDEALARKAMTRAAAKLPCKVSFVQENVVTKLN